MIFVDVPNEKVLVDSGVIERPVFQLINGVFSSEELPELEFNGTLKFINEKTKKDPNADWCIHQDGSELILPAESSTEKQTLKMRLYDALPAPTMDTPIYDILEFRERRKDEFTILHDYIDDIYLDILASPDRDLSEQKAINKLNMHVSDLDKITREKWNTIRKITLDTRFSITDFFKHAGMTLSLDVLAGTFPIGTLTAGFGSAFQLRIGYQREWAYSNKKPKLAYLSSASKAKLI